MKGTRYSRKLYYALKEEVEKMGLQLYAEKWDGYKHIDIAIPKAKINIEVDGSHHTTSPKQVSQDFKRDYHSFLKGYYTLRIPNGLVHSHFEETVAMILDMVKESKFGGKRK